MDIRSWFRKKPPGEEAKSVEPPAEKRRLEPSTSSTRPRKVRKVRKVREPKNVEKAAKRGFWEPSKQAWSQRMWWPVEATPTGGRAMPASAFVIRESGMRGRRAGDGTTWADVSMAGRVQKENTMSLTTAEKKERSRAYKDLGDEAMEQKKSEFDAAMAPRVTRSRMTKLHPSQEQRKWMLWWFKDTRKTYNLAMAHSLNQGLHRRRPGEVNLRAVEKELQNMFVTKEGVMAMAACHHRLLRTPKVPRQQAVKSVVAVFKAHYTREKKRLALKAKYPGAVTFRREPKFRPGFKQKRLSSSDSINIEKRSLRLQGNAAVGLFYRMKFGKTALFRHLEAHPGIGKFFPLTCDFKLHFSKGSFFLAIPSRRPPKAIPSRLGTEHVAAVDPGVRVPFTVYSPEGSVAEVGTNAREVLDKLLGSIDRGRQRMRTVLKRVEVERRAPAISKKTRRNQRRRIRRARQRNISAEARAKDVIKDLHYKTAHYLLRRFRTIILPDTSSHRWRTNALHAGTKKRSMMLRHGMFAERLVQTSTDYTGSRVLRCSEAYTSKQCGACGELNDSLGSSKVFSCEACGATADRDVHAARNILLRCIA